MQAYFLEVNKKASNIAFRSELGHFLLSITITKKILKYILYYMQSKDEELLSNSFHSHLMNKSEYFKLPDFNPDLLDIAMVKSYVSSMKQEYILYWQSTLQHSQKLEFYRSFKTDHTTSSYLELTRGTSGRRALATVKLRISNHKLMIEIARYNQTTKDNIIGIALFVDPI